MRYDGDLDAIRRDPAFQELLNELEPPKGDVERRIGLIEFVSQETGPAGNAQAAGGITSGGIDGLHVARAFCAAE